jgi:hypothetical protein
VLAGKLDSGTAFITALRDVATQLKPADEISQGFLAICGGESTRDFQVFKSCYGTIRTKSYDAVKVLATARFGSLMQDRDVGALIGGFEILNSSPLVDGAIDPNSIPNGLSKGVVAQLVAVNHARVDEIIAQFEEFERLAMAAAKLFAGMKFKVNDKAKTVSYEVADLAYLVKLGNLVRHYCLANNHRHCGLNTFLLDSDGPAKVEKMWVQAQDHITAMRSAMNASVVLCNQNALTALSQAMQKTNAEKANALVLMCTSLFVDWVDSVAPTVFTDITTNVKSVVEKMETPAIVDAAATTPVALGDLKAFAKSEAARELYVAYSAFTNAQTSYADCCRSIGAQTKEFKTDFTKCASTTVCIFHAVQGLTKKVKDPELRGPVCADVLKKIGNVQIPSPLLLALTTAAGKSKASANAAATGSSADAFCVD